jgi:hypothetical protein
MCNRIILVLSMMAAASGTAFAAHPLITDDTGTQGKGRFQFELNGAYGHNRDEGEITQAAQLATTFTYGLSETLDIIVSLPWQRTRYEDATKVTKRAGTSDATVEAKWRFFEKEGLSLALKPGFTLPTGNEEKTLGSGKATCHLFFIASNEHKPWTSHVNLGYVRNENTVNEKNNLWHASLAATFDLTENFKIVGNIGVERDTGRDLNIPNAFLLGGFIHAVSKNIDIDIGIKAGLTRPEADYTILTGITWRL